MGHLQIELEGAHCLICYFKIFLSFCFYWLRRSLFLLVTFLSIICLIFYLNSVCFVQNLPEQEQLKRHKNFATSLESLLCLSKIADRCFFTIMNTRSRGSNARRIYSPRTLLQSLGVTRPQEQSSRYITANYPLQGCFKGFSWSSPFSIHG